MKAPLVSRRWRFGVSILYAVLLLAPFLSLVQFAFEPSPALAADTTGFVFHAADTANWVDAAHIAYAGKTYTDAHLDGDYRFDGVKNCDQPDQLNSFSGGITSSEVRFEHHYKDSLSGKCITQGFTGIKVGVPSTNREIAFNWSNTQQVTAVDGSASFNYDSSANLFIKNEDKCKDTIQTDSNSPSTGTLVIRADTADHVASNYEGYPFSIDKTKVKKESSTGCQAITLDKIRLGNTAASKAAAPPAATCTGADCNPQTTVSSCQIENLGWLLCPIITLANKTITLVEDKIIEELKVAPLQVTLGGGSCDPSSNASANCDPTFVAWDRFRLFANIAFILIFLAIIFANTLSIGISNYNIKKMLPRLVIAVILVQFSYVLMAIAVDASNLLGKGLEHIIPSISVAGCANQNTNPLNIVGAVGSFATLGAVLVASLSLGFGVPLLMIVVAAVLALMGVWLTLGIRIVLIKLLVFLAPLAFAAWILPNTENYFKKWGTSFIKLLLMYPIIQLLISTGALVSQGIACSSQGNTAGGLFGAIVPIAVFVMIPGTFKMAGGVMGAVAGAVTARTSGWGRSARQSQAAKEARKEAAGKIKTFQSGGGVNAFGRQMLGSGSRSGRIAAALGRTSTLTSKRSATRGDSQNMKHEGELMDLEGYTPDDMKMLVGQKDHYMQEMMDLDRAELAGEISPDQKAQRVQSLEASRSKTQGQWGNAARVGSAAEKLGGMGLADDGMRKSLQTRFKGREQLGQQIWAKAAADGRSTNPLLMFTSLDGRVDKKAAAGFLKRQNQAAWAGYSTDLYKGLASADLDATGKPVAGTSILSDLKADAGVVKVIETAKSGASGPSMGAAQEAVLASPATAVKDDSGRSIGDPSNPII